MRYTKETFFEKAVEIYGGKYDYSQSEYVNQSTAIKIICPDHGEFFRTPTYYLQGGDCPVCARARLIAGMHKPMSEEAKAKRRATNLRKYGATTYAGSQMSKDRYVNDKEWVKSIHEKMAATNLERYGAKTYAESEEGRIKSKAHWADPEVRKRASERAKSKEFREKYERTTMEHYGTTHWAKSERGKQRMHELFSTDEERLARSQRMLSPEVRAKIEATSMKRYGTPYYWQSEEGRIRLKELLNSEEVVEKTRQTNLERYGNETWQGSDAGRFKLASNEVRSKTEQTNMERYGAKTWSNSEDGHRILSSDEVQQKIINTKRINGTFNDSQPEREAYVLLQEHFGKDNVIAQYRCDRYPFKCDFYVKPLDLFIELNAYWMHGGHWFDADNPDDVEILQMWMVNPKPSYERAVYVWSVNDLEKRDTAKKCGLNYLVFWDNDLTDMRRWIADGCSTVCNC